MIFKMGVIAPTTQSTVTFKYANIILSTMSVL